MDIVMNVNEKVMSANMQDNNAGTSGTHPLKFALWLIIMSITMMFAAFTSAYMVKMGDGNWLTFDLPPIMIINTVVIVLSSISMQWAFFAAKKDNLNMLKIMLFITTVLGSVFLFGQWEAWEVMSENKIAMLGSSSNPSASFLFVLTSVHGFHIITGLVFLIITFVSALQYKVHSRSMLRLSLCTTYWHFLGGLWLYLYLFLSYYR